MNWDRVAAYYAVFIGVSMLGMWALFFVTGSIPELETKPLEIYLHLAAEFGTALMLISGGFGLLAHRAWGLPIHLLAMGMLFYSLINSPGYFLQQGELPLVIMFAVFLLVGVAVTIPVVKESRYQRW